MVNTPTVIITPPKMGPGTSPLPQSIDKVDPKKSRINSIEINVDSTEDIIVHSIYENYWNNLKQIATEFFSAGMHSGEVSLKHTKNPLLPLWGKQIKVI